jgi:hypothetical protein
LSSRVAETTRDLSFELRTTQLSLVPISKREGRGEIFFPRIMGLTKGPIAVLLAPLTLHPFNVSILRAFHLAKPPDLPDISRPVLWPIPQI